MVVVVSEVPAESPLTKAEWRSLTPASRAWICGLVSELRELHARIGKNSTNSSKPPSSDLPQVKRPARRRSGRRRGGQPGHRGHSRPLVSDDRISKTVEVRPPRCRRCGSRIEESGLDHEALRHQVAEIPAIEPTVVEYRRRRGTCGKCGTVTTGELPAGVPKGNFGPNLRALLVALSGRFRLSRREVVEFCEEVLGLTISVGCVSDTCLRMGRSLAAPVRGVRDEIRMADVVHPDESGWAQAGRRHWIWVAATRTAAYFRIARRRSAAIVKEILGEDFEGQIVSDRWSAYGIIPAERRQVCWAHLKRDFQGFVDRGGEGKDFGEEGVRLSKELFAIWHRYERNELSRLRMRGLMAEVEIEVGRLLGAGHLSSDAKVLGFCMKLLEVEPSLFLFARTQGVEPTNNRAERALRPVVLWRKGSFGTWSYGGSRFVERLMTVVMTCRIRGRPILRYLEAVCGAMDHGAPIPSLFEKARDHPGVGDAAADQRRRTAG